MTVANRRPVVIQRTGVKPLVLIGMALGFALVKAPVAVRPGRGSVGPPAWPNPSDPAQRTVRFCLMVSAALLLMVAARPAK